MVFSEMCGCVDDSSAVMRFVDMFPSLQVFEVNLGYPDNRSLKRGTCRTSVKHNDCRFSQQPILLNKNVPKPFPLQLVVHIRSKNSMDRCQLGGLRVHQHPPAPWYEFELLNKTTDGDNNEDLFLHFYVRRSSVFMFRFCRGFNSVFA